MPTPTPGTLILEHWISQTYGASDYTIYARPSNFAAERPILSTQGDREEDKANAELFIAAHETCFAVNSTDPIAAAKALPALLTAAETGAAAMRHALEFFGWASFPNLREEWESKLADIDAAIKAAKGVQS